MGHATSKNRKCMLYVPPEQQLQQDVAADAAWNTVATAAVMARRRAEGLLPPLSTPGTSVSTTDRQQQHQQQALSAPARAPTGSTTASTGRQ